MHTILDYFVYCGGERVSRTQSFVFSRSSDGMHFVYMVCVVFRRKRRVRGKEGERVGTDFLLARILNEILFIFIHNVIYK